MRFARVSKVGKGCEQVGEAAAGHRRSGWPTLSGLPRTRAACRDVLRAVTRLAIDVQVGLVGCPGHAAGFRNGGGLRVEARKPPGGSDQSASVPGLPTAHCR